MTCLPWSDTLTTGLPQPLPQGVDHLWVSAADKGCRVYPLDPRPDAAALYSACSPGERRAWFLPDDQHTASLGLHVE
ncbi:hypothetical protein TNCV_3449981 [Trichonephila clavipes]|nr:hypothetical protein TNCV_3449981 [Trichonephila clavipes]